MFIDLELVNELQDEGLTYHEIEEYVEDNGIWYTLEKLKEETEDNNLTLEDAMHDYYFTVIGNEIKFCFSENIF